MKTFNHNFNRCLYHFFFHFYLYIYPPDWQESDGGAIHRVSNYPDLLPEMPSYCLNSVFNNKILYSILRKMSVLPKPIVVKLGAEYNQQFLT